MTRRVIYCSLITIATVSAVVAQRNNPFSANPRSADGVAVVIKDAKAIPTASKPTAQDLVRPTDIYKVGAGDLLNIVLANAPHANGIYSVASDGSIDFPLAGPRMNVAGLTPAEVGGLLSSRITLYRNARVEVTVREFGSHKIDVTGMVERNGERSLQREAMPLYTIKAVVGVDRAASRVRIRRAGMTFAQDYDLRSDATDDILVRPGDVLEFIGE